MSKLCAFGVCGELSNWLADFLRERTQRVVFRGDVSGTVKVLSGVPQGSVPGPTLFNVFVNDVVASPRCKPLPYAEDLILLQPICSLARHQRFERELDTVCAWSCPKKNSV